MKKFDEQYKEFYDNIKADDELKERILITCLNQKKKKELKNTFWIRRTLIAICSILIFVIFSSSIVFANEIKDFVKTHIFKMELNEERSNEENKDVYTFTIENPINEKVNCDTDINEEMSVIRKTELEEKLGIKLLTSDFYENDFYHVNIIEKVNNQLAYANFSRDAITKENSFFKEDVEKQIFKNTKLELNAIFLTPYATEEIKNNRIAIHKYIYNNEKFEVDYISSLGIDVYFAPLFIMSNESDIEIINIAYFIYDNVMYSVTGNFVSKNTVLDFIKTLHY